MRIWLKFFLLFILLTGTSFAQFALNTRTALALFTVVKGTIHATCSSGEKIRINSYKDEKIEPVSIYLSEEDIKKIAKLGCAHYAKRSLNLGSAIYTYGGSFLSRKYIAMTPFEVASNSGEAKETKNETTPPTTTTTTEKTEDESKSVEPKVVTNNYFNNDSQAQNEASKNKFNESINGIKVLEGKRDNLIAGITTQNSEISSNLDKKGQKEDEIQKSKDAIDDYKLKRKEATTQADKDFYTQKIDEEKANISKVEAEIKGLNKENKGIEKSIAQDEKTIEKQNDEIESQIDAADDLRSAEQSEIVASATSSLDKAIKSCSKSNRIYKHDTAEVKAEKNRKLEECKNQEIETYNQEMANYHVSEAYVADSNPSKEFDATYFDSYVGAKVFNGYCANSWKALQEHPESLEEIINNPPSDGFEPATCKRYSTVSIDEFYSTKRNLEDTAKELINRDILCTDTAVGSSASCAASAQKFVACSKIKHDNVSRKLDLCSGVKIVKNGEVPDYVKTAEQCQDVCMESSKDALGTCFNDAKYTQLSKKIEHCFAYKSVATINFDGEERIDNEDVEYTSFDGKYPCQRTSPFTADYQYCKKLVTAYNAAFAADQGMAMAEGIQRSAGQANAMGKFVEGQATGNAQVAGLNGVQAIAKTNENIENQKLILSGAKVAAFTTLVLNWPTVNNIHKTCTKAGVQHPQECSNAVHFANQNGSAKKVFFPNYFIKQAFYAELIKSAGDAAVALIKGNMYRKQQKLIDGVKDMTVETEDSGGFVYNPTYCEQYPTSTQCRGSGNRVSVDGISGGGLNLVGGGAQDYSFSNDDLGEYNEGRDVTSNAQKADISSMLNDNVQKGGSDFNKVAGAKVSASGASGGGSPGAGGGSASLVGGGSGGEGAEGAAKDSFDVTKSNAKYAAAGGAAGYSGSKARQFGKDKKVDNPFSSLFGAKKNSRDVASNAENDIAPAQSSLFKKISNRYMEVKNQKRLLDSQVK